MTRKHNLVGGGAQTNKNGLSYERDYDLSEAIINSGKYTIDDNAFVIEKSTNVKKGKLASKNDFYLYLEKKHVLWNDIVSKKYLPDEAFFNFKKKILYIVEKKYQDGFGSVDEKLQTFPFKKERYEDLVKSLKYSVSFYFLGNDYFNKSTFGDVWEYFETHQIKKYISQKIPLKDFGL